MLNANPHLYKFILNEFNTFWQPLPYDKVKNNLHNNEQENIQYLGTYFPRSYKESYVILKNIVKLSIKLGYHNKKLNIIDLGSGTGGQLFALLQILEEELEQPITINIFSIDGNKNALNIQNILFNYMKAYSKHKIYLYTYIKEFKNSEDIYTFLSSFYDIDILLSFKFLSEMLMHDINIWYATLKACNHIIKPNGILCFNDVSMKIKIKNKSYEEFIPIYINHNIKKYLLEKDDFNTLEYLIPFCCSKHINHCPRENCYTQFKIDVQYINENNQVKTYTSNIDYKIFMQNGDLYDTIINKAVNHTCTNVCSYDRRDCLCLL